LPHASTFRALRKFDPQLTEKHRTAQRRAGDLRDIETKFMRFHRKFQYTSWGYDTRVTTGEFARDTAE
jgi:hypothetical protein